MRGLSFCTATRVVIVSKLQSQGICEPLQMIESDFQTTNKKQLIQYSHIHKHYWGVSIHVFMWGSFASTQNPQTGTALQMYNNCVQALSFSLKMHENFFHSKKQQCAKRTNHNVAPRQSFFCPKHKSLKRELWSTYLQSDQGSRAAAISHKLIPKP